MPTGDARLARHLRHLGRMYPVLAHDLHAFLNTMALNLELLQLVASKEELDSEAVARIRRYASIVASELSPLDRMLKAVVGQMRLSDPPTTTRFDFRALFEQLSLVFDAFARSRRLRVRTTLADVPMAVTGDRDAVAHALTSIFLETIEALPAGSSVEISLQADRRQAVVTLAVERPAAEPAAAAGEAVPEPDLDARAALERHGARVLETPGPGGSALEITLPLAPLSS